MGSSREESPDWLRTFQAPTKYTVTLSSGSESPQHHDDEDDDNDDGISLSNLFRKEIRQITETKMDQDEGKLLGDDLKKEILPNKNIKGTNTQGTAEKRKNRRENAEKNVQRRVASAKKKGPGKLITPQEQDHSIWTLSSDSESCPDPGPVRADNALERELMGNGKDLDAENKRDKDASLLGISDDDSKLKSHKRKLKDEDQKSKQRKNVKTDIKGGEDGDVNVEEGVRKQHTAQISSSRLPLVLSEKVQRSKALVECEGDSIDLSGDVGAVGRIVISDNPSRNHDVFLDLKGTIYKTTIVPSRTFCVVSFGQSEAKIEAIMNDFIRLTPQSNVDEAETMVEGTLAGFSFDSEDDVDNLPKTTKQTEQKDDVQEEPEGKGRKKAVKTSGTDRKKGKTAGGKPPKNVKKKGQAPKKGKRKK